MIAGWSAVAIEYTAPLRCAHVVQVRPDHDVGFDRDHHHADAALERAKGVQRTGFFVTGRFDQHVELARRCDLAALDEGGSGHPRARSFAAFAFEAGAKASAAQPAAAAAAQARLGSRSASTASRTPVISRSCAEDHRAELARADQADANRMSGRFALAPARVQGSSRRFQRAVRTTRAGARGSRRG